MPDVFDSLWEEQFGKEEKAGKGVGGFDSLWEEFAGPQERILPEPVKVPQGEEIFGRTFQGPKASAELTGVPGFATEAKLTKEVPAPAKKYWEEEKRTIKGAGEAALAMGTGFAAFPVAMTAEALAVADKLIGRGEEPFPEELKIGPMPEIGPAPSPKEARQKVMTAMTYQPKTEEGMNIANLMGKPFEALFWPAEKVRQFVTEQAGETAGSIAGLASEAGTMILLGLLHRRGDARVKTKTEARKTAQVIDEAIKPFPEEQKAEIISRAADKAVENPTDNIGDLLTKIAEDVSKEIGKPTIKPEETEIAPTPTPPRTEIVAPMPSEEAISEAKIQTSPNAQIPSKFPSGEPTLGFGPTQGFQKLYESLTTARKRTPSEKYARAINIKRQNIPKEMKKFQLEVAKLFPPKEVQTWEMTEAMAKDILIDIRKTENLLRRAKDRQPLMPHEQEAVRLINVGAIANLAEKAKSLSKENWNKLLEDYSENVFAITSDAATTAGRALNIYRKEVSITRLGKILAEMRGGMNNRQWKDFKSINEILAKDVAQWTEADKVQLQRFIDRLPSPKLKEYFYEYWYNCILSGPPTHLINFASNTLWMTYQIPHRALTGMLDAMISKFTGKERQVFTSEVLPMLAGIKTGAKKGAGGAVEVMKKGDAAEWTTKWNREMGEAITSAFERSDNAFLRDMAPYITAPTRALRAMDVWANSIAFDAQLKALIHRKGLNKGLKGEDLAAFEKDFKPTQEMIGQANDFAKYATFMDDPGALASGILQIREKVPGARLIIPFVTTIGNLMKRGLEMTPGIGVPLLKGKPIAEVMAKQIEGGILALWVWDKYQKGDIVGPHPESPAERDAFYRLKKLPYSVRIGDIWLQWRRIEPFNTVMAAMLAAFDRLKKTKDPSDYGAIFWDMIVAVKDNLIDSSYLQGLSRFLEKGGKLPMQVYSTVASLIPASSFLRSINRAIEALSEDHATVKEVRDVWAALAGILPWTYDLVNKKLNVWGEEIESPGGAFRQWFPIKWSEGSTDAVENELDRLGRYPAWPSKTMVIGNARVQLPEDFYRQSVIDTGRAMKQALNSAIYDMSYLRASDEEKIKIIDRELRRARKQKSDEQRERFLKTYGKPPQTYTGELKLTGGKIYVPASTFK